jgi:hypothetical protein
LKQERTVLFVKNREFYVGLACVKFEAFPALCFQGFCRGNSASLSFALRTLVPFDDVAAGSGTPFNSSPAITVERNVFPTGKGFDLAGDVDSCHFSVHLWRTGR